MKVTKDQKSKVRKIAEEYGLKLVVIFGSFAAGKSRKGSDLDIGILAPREISFENQIDLINKFSQVFKKNIDSTNLATANPLLLFEATKNVLPVYGENSELAKLKLKAFHAYNDYLPFFRMERELDKEIIKFYAN